MPLQVPIDINNQEMRYTFAATNLIFDAHSLEPLCSPIVFSFRNFTLKVLSTLYDAQQDAAALLDICSRRLDSGEELDEAAHTQIRKLAASFDAVRVAIKAGEDNILSIKDPLLSIMGDKYGPRPTSVYARWFGKPSKGTMFIEALPTKLQDLAAQLQQLREIVNLYEEHIQCMCLQLLGITDGSEAEVIAGKLRLLTEEMRSCVSIMPDHLIWLQIDEELIGKPPMWAWPVIRRMEDNFIRRDDWDTMLERDAFYYPVAR